MMTAMKTSVRNMGSLREQEKQDDNAGPSSSRSFSPTPKPVTASLTKRMKQSVRNMGSLLEQEKHEDTSTAGSSSSTTPKSVTGSLTKRMKQSVRNMGSLLDPEKNDDDSDGFDDEPSSAISPPSSPSISDPTASTRSFTKMMKKSVRNLTTTFAPLDQEQDTFGTASITTGTVGGGGGGNTVIEEEYDDEGSMSQYSSDSDDSADLFVEDDMDATTHDSSQEEEDEEWMEDDDIKDSTQLIWKIMFLLCSSLFVVSVVTIHYSRKHTQEEFVMAYEDVAHDILDVVRARSENVANIIHILSRTITTSAGPDANWPLYTPDFLEDLSEEFLQFGSNVELVFSPLVTYEELVHWESYTEENQGMVLQSTDYPFQISPFIYSRERDGSTTPIIGGIPQEDHDDNTTNTSDDGGPYSPVWQIIPPPNDYQNTSKVNYNLLSNHLLKDPIRASYLSGKAVVSDLSFPDKLYGISLFGNDGQNVHVYNPASVIIQPVFRTLKKNHNHNSSSSSSTTPPETQSTIIDVEAVRATKPEGGGTTFTIIDMETSAPSEADLQSQNHDRSDDNHHHQNHPPAEDHVVVGHIVATIPWTHYLKDTVAHPDDQVFSVIENSCTGDAYTYVITGGENQPVDFYGLGDIHNGVTRFEDVSAGTLELTISSYEAPEATVERNWALDEYDSSLLSSTGKTCRMTLNIYPTEAMSWRYNSNAAITHLLAMVFFVFVLVGIAILTHHRITDVHLRDTHAQGKRSKAIIASLFPEAIREKLFDVEGEVNVDKLGLLNNEAQKATDAAKKGPGGENGIEDLWGNRENYGDVYESCTVCVADICGFSAWSSSRDPSEVFTLLEAAFSTFDKIAKRRGAYKVETVGDSFIAVAGLPNKRKDHALVMAKFARDALNDFIELSNKLEISLGPDTSDLGVRLGIASGPVVAGVIRGDRARYQVFGKTVSKCRKLEEAGQPDRIHIAKETADLITKAGFGSWVRARGVASDKKKKGDTYWLLPKRAVKQAGRGDSSITNFHDSYMQSFSRGMDFSNQSQLRTSTNSDGPMSHSIRLAPIVAPLMNDDSSNLYQVRGHSIYESHEQSLSQGMDYSNATSTRRKRLSLSDTSSTPVRLRASLKKKRSSMHLVPEARESQSAMEKVDRLIFWNSETLSQVLRHISARRAASGRRRFFKDEMLEAEARVSNGDKPILQEVQEPIPIPTNHIDFSNTDSSNYELSGQVEEQLFEFVRIISTLYPQANPYTNFEHASHTAMHMQKLLSRLDPSSQGSCGISKDPLIQFAMILSTLIRAVNHNGMGASAQDSLEIAWQALMDPEYEDLRRCIYTDENELRLFRSVLTHCVVATDLDDESLKSIRNERWEKAFYRSQPSHEESISRQTNSLKGTAVIEHMSLVAAMAHTMQHWDVYCKWSQCLFFEKSAAFLELKSQYDPAKDWFKHELDFFDDVVIPLAKRLLEIKLLGSSTNEYLENADSNRSEWEDLGSDLLVNMVDKFQHQYGGQGKKSTGRRKSKAPGFLRMKTR